MHRTITPAPLTVKQRTKWIGIISRCFRKWNLGGKHMETWYYDVVSIDGDYANLKRCDIESDDLKLVARALLPPEIMEGSRLKYELMQYEIIQ